MQGVAALFALPSGMTQQKQQRGYPLLSHASIHLGRVAVRLLCQDVTAFLVLQIQLGKAGKRKELH